MLKPDGLYYMYLRKSREDLDAEQHGSGETLARHETLLRETAERLNITITAVYREIVSGETIAARPEMLRLLNDIELHRPDGVLVTEIPRLARGDTRDQGLVMETFKYAGTYIITPMKLYNPNDEFDEEYAEFGLFMSRREYASIKRRLAGGKLASVKEGKFAGSRAPYGYEKYKLPDEKGYSLTIRPEQAQIVTLIYKLYLNGAAESGGKPLGPSAIATLLNDMHIPTQTGKPWLQGVVRTILTNQVYAGYIHWGKRKTVKQIKDGVVCHSHPCQKTYLVVKGRHQAIIPPAMWNQVQEKIKQRSSSPAFLTCRLQNSLSGILRCSICGRPMSRRPGGPHEHHDWLLCKTKGCPTAGSDYDQVEQCIVEALSHWFCHETVEPARLAQLPKPAVSTQLLETSLTSKQKQLKALNQQLEKAYYLLETDVYTPEIFQERRAILLEQIKAASAVIEELMERCQLPENCHQEEADIDGIVNTAFDTTFKPTLATPPETAANFPTIMSLYQQLSPEYRNALLKTLTAKIEYSKAKKGTRRGGAEFQLVIYPQF